MAGNTGEKVDAVVLAGSINRIALYPGNRPGRKALVELNGRPLIAYVLDALHAARDVNRVIVVAAPEVLEYARRWPRVEGVEDGHSLVRNAWRGIHAATTDRVLFCNPDQPLLRTEMLDDFTGKALAVDADIVSSWVRWESIGRYAKEGDHKFADFGDGRYAHGNLFLVRRSLPDLPAVRQRINALYAARKSNLAFAWALGPRLFFHFVVAKLRGQLPSLEETLQIGGRHFGVTIAPVVSPYPEIALDIDEPEDYAAAAEHLAEDTARRPRQRAVV